MRRLLAFALPVGLVEGGLLLVVLHRILPPVVLHRRLPILLVGDIFPAILLVALWGSALLVLLLGLVRPLSELRLVLGFAFVSLCLLECVLIDTRFDFALVRFQKVRRRLGTQVVSPVRWLIPRLAELLLVVC